MPELGATEYVVFKGMTGALSKEAKVDTGAERTTVDHNVATTIGAGPLTRTVTVRSASGTERRPVAKMWVEIGDFETVMEVGLSDRKGRDMTYQAIVGRDVLEREQFSLNI